MPYSAQRAVDPRASPRRSSRSPPATRARPPPGPCASRRCRACRRRTAIVGAWSSWSSGPSESRTSRFGSTLAQTRKKTSLVVVDVHVLVDDDDRLRQAEQAEPPDRVHDLLGVAGERLADRDDHAVVERAGDGQVVVDDLGHAHPDRRQEDPLGRLAEPGVLGRRLADDDRRVDRVAPHRHRRHVEDRERLRRGE